VLSVTSLVTVIIIIIIIIIIIRKLSLRRVEVFKVSSSRVYN